MISCQKNWEKDVCVCMLLVFCHHVHLDPKISVRTDSSRHGVNFLIQIFTKNTFFRSYGIQLHLSHKIWIPMESIQRGHDIAIRNYNYIYFLNSEFTVHLPSSTYPKYKYVYTTVARGQKLSSRCVCAHIIMYA